MVSSSVRTYVRMCVCNNCGGISAVQALVLSSTLRCLMFCCLVAGCKSMNDLQRFNSDVQSHVTVDRLLDGSSWFSSQPYDTCTLPYGHADTARANARVPTYAAGTRQHIDQRCACASPTENHFNSTTNGHAN